MQDNPFFKCWFNGFQSAIEEIDIDSRHAIFEACAKACSQSYSRKVYLDAYEATDNMDDFLQMLKRTFAELDYRVSHDGTEVEFIYTHCACDLVTQGFMNSGHLCECSRRSLLYNWESVLGKDRVDVSIQKSILRGQGCCLFIVKIKELAGWKSVENCGLIGKRG